MFDQKKKKSLLLGMAVFLILTGVLIVFVRHLDGDVFEILAATRPNFLLLLGGFSVLCILLDALIYQTAFSDTVESLSFGSSMALAGLRIFCASLFVTGGALPIQSYYLYRKGTMPGKTVGLTAVLYSIQKTSVLLYATVLLLSHWKWAGCAADATGFLIFSYLVCTLTILLLFLLCTSGHVFRFFVFLLGKLPESGKWPARKERWLRQVEALYQETHALFQKKTKFFRILFLNLLKLFVMCSIPFLITKMLHVNAYTMMQAQTLCALMLLLSNALPNIAGMGSIEFSFLLIFRRILGLYTSAALIYYRCATYYFPFLLSMVIVLFLQRRFPTVSAPEAQ